MGKCKQHHYNRLSKYYWNLNVIPKIIIIKNALTTIIMNKIVIDSFSVLKRFTINIKVLLDTEFIYNTSKIDFLNLFFE